MQRFRYDGYGCRLVVFCVIEQSFRPRKRMSRPTEHHSKVQLRDDCKPVMPLLTVNSQRSSSRVCGHYRKSWEKQRRSGRSWARSPQCLDVKVHRSKSGPTRESRGLSVVRNGLSPVVIRAGSFRYAVEEESAAIKSLHLTDGDRLSKCWLHSSSTTIWRSKTGFLLSRTRLLGSAVP